MSERHEKLLREMRTDLSTVGDFISEIDDLEEQLQAARLQLVEAANMLDWGAEGLHAGQGRQKLRGVCDSIRENLRLYGVSPVTGKKE